MRTQLTGTAALFIISLGLSTAANADDHARQVCGVVVQISCHASAPEVLTLMVTPGRIVDVDASSMALASELRTTVAPLWFRRACATGVPGGKEREPRLLVDAAGNIAADGATAPEWPKTDLFTPCDKGTLTLPQVTSQMRPRYTEAAMKKHVQGTALVQAIVGADGRVERLLLLRSVDAKYGLDNEALAAAREWKFTPALKDGRPVRMVVSIELTFTLRK